MIDYKKEIISMVEKMENEDFLCKSYHLYTCQIS